MNLQTLNVSVFHTCSLDLNMCTISGRVHIKTVFSFLAITGYSSVSSVMHFIFHFALTQ
jgi:hypothetical protein